MFDYFSYLYGLFTLYGSQGVLNMLEANPAFAIVCYLAGFIVIFNKLSHVMFVLAVHIPITKRSRVRYKIIVYALAAGFIKNYVYRRASGHNLSVWFLIAGTLRATSKLYTPCYVVLTELAKNIPTGVWIDVGDGQILGGYYPRCRRYKHVGVDPKTPADKLS